MINTELTYLSRIDKLNKEITYLNYMLTTVLNEFVADICPVQENGVHVIIGFSCPSFKDGCHPSVCWRLALREKAIMDIGA